jgi:hypothetical protein
MVILIVLLILGASLIERAQTAVDRASARNRQERAFQLAEAGIEKALWDLNQPNGWITYAGDSDLGLQGGTVDVVVSPPPSARGEFTSTVTVISTGVIPSAQVGRTHSCAIRMVTHKDVNYFKYAIFGSEEVSIGNGTVELITDSYASDSGDYGGTNIAAAGDIATNSTNANAIYVLPQGEVNGDLYVGAGAADPTACVDNKGTVSGTITTLDGPQPLPSIPSVPVDAIELGDIWLENDEQLVLDAGVYHATDLEIFGSASLVCNGVVTIYIDQSTDGGSPDVRIAGNGIANTSQIPANLTVFCLDDVVSVEFSGNAAFYGGLYAPNADIVLNAGHVYGSVVGRTVTLNGSNAGLHYDEALYDMTDPNAVMRSWEVL